MVRMSVGNVTRRALLLLVAVFLAYMVYRYVRLILFGANNILGGTSPFQDAAWFIGFAGFQVGAVVGAVVATAWHTKTLVVTFRNGVILVGLFVLCDALLTFTVP